jgi:alanyl-tRNA synthetase
VRRVRHRVSGAVKDAEPLVQQLLTRGPCVVLVTNEATGAVLLAASPDASLDAGQTLRAALQHAGGRGGGSPRLAQGALPDATALPALATALGF